MKPAHAQPKKKEKKGKKGKDGRKKQADEDIDAILAEIEGEIPIYMSMFGDQLLMFISRKRKSSCSCSNRRG